MVNKLDASSMIHQLKEKSLIDSTKKIAQEDENVYIPLVENDQPIPDFEIPYEITEFSFEIRESKPDSLKDALKQLLPEVDHNLYQTSYDQIGDLAVIDLNEELIKYADTVGQAILLSNPSINAVFRKSTKVDGLLRLRGLENIGGELRTSTIHKEHGLRMAVDIAQAYFSPRLATEHHRIAKLIKPRTTVLDLFGSLAPFALHITKDKDVKVVTVDINPNVPTLIQKSINLNKLQGEIEIICEDAKKFLSTISDRKFDYIIMNHPSGAFEFLNDAMKVLNTEGIIFYYDFIEIEDYQKRVKQKLKGLPIKIRNIHIVRQSSPYQYHLCVELQLETDINQN